jgi:hypothetical protein
VGPRELVLFLRSVSPFFEETVLFLSSAGDAGTRRLGDAVSRVLRRPSSLSLILRPRRPLDTGEVSRLLGLPEGPALGDALRELDIAVAAREIRGKRAAIAFLRRLPGGGVEGPADPAALIPRERGVTVNPGAAGKKGTRWRWT